LGSIGGGKENDLRGKRGRYSFGRGREGGIVAGMEGHCWLREKEEAYPDGKRRPSPLALGRRKNYGTARHN